MQKLNWVLHKMGVFVLDKVNQCHIANGAACDGQKHLALPEVNQDGCENRDKFRCSVCAMKKIDIFQAINDEHPKDGRGKIFSEILDKGGSAPLFCKNKKREKPGGHGCENTQTDGDNLLWKSHHVTYLL